MADETKVCKYCQTEIPKKAKICPNCKKKQKGKTGLIIAIVIVLLILIGAAGSGNKTESSSSTVESSKEESAKIEETIEYTSVDIASLIEDIQNNPLKASDTYKDKYIEVTGTLDVIDSDGKYISIKNGDDDWSFVNIQCYIKNDEQKAVVMDSNKGASLTVKGKVKDVGELIGYSIDIDELIAK